MDAMLARRPPRITALVGAIAASFAISGATATVAIAQRPDSVPPPMTLLRQSATEPSWAATLRLRDAEPRYRNDPQWRSTYCQLRAQSEVWLGDHAAALREIARCWGSWSD